MGEATPFDRKTLVGDPNTVATEGDGLATTVTHVPVGGDSADVRGEDEGRDLAVGTASFSTERPLDQTDADDFVLQADPPVDAAASAIGRDAGGTLVAPLAGDPTVTVKSDGRTPPAPRERPIPSIDGYEILDELGRGGMGVVYRARQVLLNRSCVLKMILAGAHADSDAIVRFLAEAEAIARMQHPNVVQIRHIGEADGLPFFELEYVEGGSLDRRLDGTPWAARLAAELVEALGAASARRTGWASSTAT